MRKIPFLKITGFHSFLKTRAVNTFQNQLPFLAGTICHIEKTQSKLIAKADFPPECTLPVVGQFSICTISGRMLKPDNLWVNIIIVLKLQYQLFTETVATSCSPWTSHKFPFTPASYRATKRDTCMLNTTRQDAIVSCSLL